MTTKPAEPTPQEWLQTVEDWGRWVADAIEGVSFDKKGDLGFRTGDPLQEPVPFSVNPNIRCKSPREEGVSVFVPPGELADTMRQLVGVVEEVKKAIQPR